jgi:hypothetical protein
LDVFFETQWLNVKYCHKVRPEELRQHKEFCGVFGTALNLLKYPNLTTVKGNQKIS